MARTWSSGMVPPRVKSPMTSKSYGMVRATDCILASALNPAAISGGMPEAVRNREKSSRR